MKWWDTTNGTRLAELADENGIDIPDRVTSATPCSNYSCDVCVNCTALDQEAALEAYLAQVEENARLQLRVERSEMLRKQTEAKLEEVRRWWLEATKTGQMEIDHGRRDTRTIEECG
jgi:hypothetical protein